VDFYSLQRHNTSTNRLSLSKDAFLKASRLQKQRFGTVFEQAEGNFSF